MHNDSQANIRDWEVLNRDLSSQVNVLTSRIKELEQELRITKKLYEDVVVPLLISGLKGDTY